MLNVEFRPYPGVVVAVPALCNAGEVEDLRADIGLAVIGSPDINGAGVVVSLVASRVLASFLFDIAPTDPASFLAAAAILLGAGVLAALIPAARASRTDPAEALRAE